MPDLSVRRGIYEFRDSARGAGGAVVARMPFSRKKHNENNAFRIFLHRKMTPKTKREMG